MIIGGLQKLSLSDYPGRISAIVFTRGCGFRCPYCHNPELVDPARFSEEYPLASVLSFLRLRNSLLEGVVVTGGEPTVHADLPLFLRSLKGMGYSVKLDTNGSNPSMLRKLVSDRLVDFIAMDVKAPLALYPETVKALVEPADIRESIQVILESGLSHEFRTTCVDPLLSADDVRGIGRLVHGCMRYVLQRFRGGNVLDPFFAPGGAFDETRLDGIAESLCASGVPTRTR
jgi:pyruvate formate lyase activating enzyme